MKKRNDDPEAWWNTLTRTEKLQIGRAVFAAITAFGHAWDTILVIEGKYGEVNNPRLADTIEDLAATHAEEGIFPAGAMTDIDYMKFARAAIVGDFSA